MHPVTRALLLLLVVAAPGLAHAAPLTVVGFNVESDDATDRVIAHQLERSRGVDLWGLTEVWYGGEWLDRLQKAAASGEGSAFGLVKGETGEPNRNLILYRADRMTLLDSEEIVVAHGRPSLAAPLAARFRLDDEREFIFLVVRLAEDVATRQGQLLGLADWSSRQALPVVAAGTFFLGVSVEKPELPAAMGPLVEDQGWAWVRPDPLVATTCDAGNRIQDFVFIAGAAASWAARSEVMFPQNNYCPDSDRTSSHRPVQASFAVSGDSLAGAGTMPERQVLPVSPVDVVMAAEPEEETYPGTPEAGASEGEPSREALLRRIEALERELEALKKAVEAGN